MRAQVRVCAGTLAVRSRHGRDWTAAVPELAPLAATAPDDLLLDGAGLPRRRRAPGLRPAAHPPAGEPWWARGGDADDPRRPAPRRRARLAAPLPRAPPTAR